MSGTNRLVNSMNTAKGGSESALTSMLENANQAVIRKDSKSESKKVKKDK